MAIVYPLALPGAPGWTNLEFDPQTVVGVHASPFTGQTQRFVWQGQWWMVKASLPPMTVAQADAWVAFLLSLNGAQGTFNLGDLSRPLTRGNAAGAWLVGAGNVAGSTTLTTQAGAGSFAVGDWLQISTYLHKVIKVVDATHYDLWPSLRTAYANGVAITYSNAVGLFRLTDNKMKWNVNTVKHYGLEINAAEAL